MIHPIFSLSTIKYEYLNGKLSERWGALDTPIPYLLTFIITNHFLVYISFFLSTRQSKRLLSSTIKARWLPSIFYDKRAAVSFG